MRLFLYNKNTQHFIGQVGLPRDSVIFPEGSVVEAQVGEKSIRGSVKSSVIRVVSSSPVSSTLEQHIVLAYASMKDQTGAWVTYKDE